ncbi:hypothetical protein S40293_10165 [Stachybotrys chartarum IBT 40293]|nr:hypothetical protein S40293_10165 [Stachybotrys chartarum IBT 40293]
MGPIVVSLVKTLLK